MFRNDSRLCNIRQTNILQTRIHSDTFGLFDKIVSLGHQVQCMKIFIPNKVFGTPVRVAFLVVSPVYICTHSFIHTEHLYSASSRELLRGAPDSSTLQMVHGMYSGLVPYSPPFIFLLN